MMVMMRMMVSFDEEEVKGGEGARLHLVKSAVAAARCH